MAATDEIEENGLTKIHSDSKHTGSFQLNEYLVESPTNNHSAGQKISIDSKKNIFLNEFWHIFRWLNVFIHYCRTQ